MKFHPNDLKAILRQDFSSFQHRAFAELNPNTPFLSTWHVDLIAAKLEACRRREIKRLIVNLQPRSLKSHIASISFPAFLLGHEPSAQIICVSYGQDLASKLSIDCRKIMTAAWYQDLFATRLSPYKQSANEFQTTANGTRLATSIGGALTGRGADFIIIDDPLKPDEALSQTSRTAANLWFDNTLRSRLNNKTTGCIIIIMQRLHEDDLVGHVLEQENWEVLRLPAVAEEDETHVITSPLVSYSILRKCGEALHPAREPLAALTSMRSNIGEYNFSGQYQQRPAPFGGGIIKEQWFRSYVPGEQPSKFEIVFQSWDTANKSSELSDYSVCSTWGLKKRKLYLLNVFRKRLEFPELKRAIISLAAEFKAANILIEDKASGTSLIQDLIHDGVSSITRYEPTIDKVMRLNSVSSTIENGFVYLPAKAEWLPAYVHELTTFPASKHDDQADSTSQALDWVKTQVNRYPLFRYALVDAMRNGRPISKWMIDEFEQDQEPVKCPECGSAPAQNGRSCNCNACGHRWEIPNPFDPEIVHTCCVNGAVLYWDSARRFWVDYITGATYPEGPA